MFPTAPHNLKVTDVTGSSLAIEWGDTMNETGYAIQRSQDSTSWSNRGSVEQDSTTFTDSGLPSFTNYYYRVRAENGSRTSAWSDVAVGTTTGNFDLYDIRSYVAMGDSYSAGEGLFPYFADSMSGDNKCHRSPRAYPSFVKAPSSELPLAARYFSREEGIDWRFIACSGAKTSNVWRGDAAQAGEVGTQLNQGAITGSTNLVTITIGGNDAGFTDVLDLCFRHACMSPSYRPFDPDRSYKEWLEAEIDSLWDDLNATYSEIREASPSAVVAVLGYPRLFPATRAEQNCLKLNPWDGEQTDLNAMTARLDGIIAREADAVGSFFIPVASHFAGHEVCGNAGEWINGPALEPALCIPPLNQRMVRFIPMRPASASTQRR